MSKESDKNKSKGKEKSKGKKKKAKICDYPIELSGIATNRFGGNQLQRERGLKGGTYGPAGPCKTLTADQIRECEADVLRKYA